MRDDNREYLIRQALNAKYDSYVKSVILEIKALPDSCRQSGDDSNLKDVWEEYCFQLQEGDSVFFSAYEDVIRQVCLELLDKLSEDELRLLWAGRDPLYSDDLDELEGFAVASQMKCDVADELLRQVNCIAESFDLGDDL